MNKHALKAHERRHGEHAARARSDGATARMLLKIKSQRAKSGSRVLTVFQTQRRSFFFVFHHHGEPSLVAMTDTADVLTPPKRNVPVDLRVRNEVQNKKRFTRTEWWYRTWGITTRRLFLLLFFLTSSSASSAAISAVASSCCLSVFRRSANSSRNEVTSLFKVFRKSPSSER